MTPDMEGRGVEGWPVIKPESDKGPEIDSLTGTEPVKLTEPDRGMEAQLKGSDRPVKGMDGPVNGMDEPDKDILGPVKGIEVKIAGPVKGVVGPVKGGVGPVTDSAGPVNATDGPGVGIAAEVGRSEESSLSPKTSAIVREPIGVAAE